jgi:tetratricopeptide (TPR) repeat protein
VKNREQTYYILGALVLLALLFFGFDTKPSSQKTLEKSRVLNAPSFDIEIKKSEAKKNLQADQINNIETLESQIRFAEADSLKTGYLKELSGYWFQLNQPLLAGYYAKQIAEMQQDAQSWSITGTTFASALSREEFAEDDKLIARDQAVEAFENAISLEPNVVEHRVNQALCYIETPDSAQPMKGVQMLAALATKYPESALPPFHLARLAMKTGQIGRAEERIKQAIALDSTNVRIACLASEIYNEAKKPEEARKWQDLCASLK